MQGLLFQFLWGLIVFPLFAGFVLTSLGRAWPGVPDAVSLFLGVLDATIFVQGDHLSHVRQ